MKIFGGLEVLGRPEQIDSNTGTLGIPEFGTKFVRGMLTEQTKLPLLRNSFKSLIYPMVPTVHLGNAEELIRLHNIPSTEVIGCRDDIMVYLIQMALKKGIAFKEIMEGASKGKGIPDDFQADHERK